METKQVFLVIRLKLPCGILEDYAQIALQHYCVTKLNYFGDSCLFHGLVFIYCITMEQMLALVIFPSSLNFKHVYQKWILVSFM
jgi:hypothetical protein